MSKTINQLLSVSKINYKHGYAHKEKLYNVWKSMKDRCNREKCKSYKSYGMRGIKVCEEWSNNYVAFRTWAYNNGYDPNAKFQECTIDRIDNNGNYEPNNCRVVSMKIQALNKQNSLSNDERYGKCLICGKTFVKKSRNDKITCSRKCGFILVKIKHKEKTRDLYKKECPICHKIFEDRSGHFKDRIYCSNVCKGLSLSPIWELNGEKHRIKEWEDILNISAHCLLHRVNDLGWSIEKALTTSKQGAKNGL